MILSLQIDEVRRVAAGKARALEQVHSREREREGGRE